MIILQLELLRHDNLSFFSIDIVFLILIYFCHKSSFLKSMIFATITGWGFDYFIGGITGVFGISRVLVAIIVFQMSKYMDIKNKLISFVFIFVNLSSSNLLANILLNSIAKLPINLNLILIQPLITAITGIILMNIKTIRDILYEDKQR